MKRHGTKDNGMTTEEATIGVEMLEAAGHKATMWYGQRAIHWQITIEEYPSKQWRICFTRGQVDNYLAEKSVANQAVLS